ncbi:MAG: hypothetical protein U5J99_01415 [Parvularculaceae bacterium]|nr:hypothetical protein [Parvularculaceae bacterium]
MPGFAPFGVPFEFFLFASTLIGIALFHHPMFTVGFTVLGSIIAATNAGGSGSVVGDTTTMLLIDRINSLVVFHV